MGVQRQWNRLRKLLRAARPVSEIGLAVIAAALVADPELFAGTPFVERSVAVLRSRAPVFVGLCVLGLVTSALGSHLLRDPALLSAVKAVLDQFRDGVFRELQGDDAHHRVTLFKRRRFYLRGFDLANRGWPGSGWLVPVARSGHTAQRTNVRFLAPDDTDRAQGIAGRAWAAMSGTADVNELPSVSDEHGAIGDYAERSNVTTKWVERRMPHSRALMGFRIENRTGEPWGVLVVDSRHPNIEGNRAGREYRNHGKVLSHLVEGI